MDTTTAVTHVSLCAGYGGIDLGLKRAIPDLRTVAFSEIEAFACANLVAKMEAGLLDAAPVWTNLKTFPWSEFRGKVDILSGGYPCQPFSAAGKRLGTEDPRHLWPFIANGIRLMQPRLCFFENVEGHISLGLRAVVEELGSLGYKATWGIFSASEVGAPHQRKRVFILAYNTSLGIQGHWADWLQESRPYAGQRLPLRGSEGCGELADSPSDGLNESLFNRKEIEQAKRNATAGSCAWPSRPGQPQYEWEPPRVVGDAPEQRLSQRGCGEIHESRSVEELKRPDQIVGNAGSLEQHRIPESSEWGEGSTPWEPSNGWQAQPPLGGDADGVAGGLDHAELYFTCDNRTDELRLLGNGVVPATATLALLTLLKRFA